MDYGDYGDYGDKCGILYIHGMFPMISDICLNTHGIWAFPLENESSQSHLHRNHWPLAD